VSKVYVLYIVEYCRCTLLFVLHCFFNYLVCALMCISPIVICTLIYSSIFTPLCKWLEDQLRTDFLKEPTVLDFLGIIQYFLA